MGVMRAAAALLLAGSLGWGLVWGAPGVGGLGAGSGAAWALQPEEKLDDPALEARARALSKGLRCVVCQNQSIDDSDAPLAGDMRRMVRTRLLAGDTDAQILARLETAYGEYVHMRPRFSLQNAAIWIAPFLALVLGVALMARRVRQGQERLAAAEGAGAGAASDAAPEPVRAPALTAEEQARLKRLLDE